MVDAGDNIIVLVDDKKGTFFLQYPLNTSAQAHKQSGDRSCKGRIKTQTDPEATSIGTERYCGEEIQEQA